MWLWECEFRELGLRWRGDRFRVCERRYGLTGHDHITVFSWGEQRHLDGRVQAELTEFHVTFYRAGHALHFYYHEIDHNRWRHGGHTSRRELARLGLCARSLRRVADAAAREFIRALGGEWTGRPA
jgi:hypothetical protein